jgi:AcrR family transcriptional regulator
VSTLSGSVPKEIPGLPRGRTSLDPVAVTADQRARLLRAVIAAVVEKGYQKTTIADIVERARVSRSVMYREFDGKLDCLLPGIEAGREEVAERVLQALAEASEGSLETVSRAMARAYLGICVAEPDHTRAWMIEVAAAGPVGVQVRDQYLNGFAALAREVDIQYGSGRPRHDGHYVATVGGIAEVVGREVRAGRSDTLVGLEDVITMILVSMLR